MAATLAGVSFSSTVVAKAGDSTRVRSSSPPCLNQPWRLLNNYKVGRMSIRTMALPDSDIHNKVSESIAAAQQACAEDPVSGECAAAWDEVEEVSAAASDDRQKKQLADANPLDAYCKDNPETDECRTYDD
ncbi:hypothetical protein ACHQM5_026295 [Ranunculus cassubicifolius]